MSTVNVTVRYIFLSPLSANVNYELTANSDDTEPQAQQNGARVVVIAASCPLSQRWHFPEVNCPAPGIRVNAAQFGK